jgi:uncharacterized protein (TIGR02246 family)
LRKTAFTSRSKRILLTACLALASACVHGQARTGDPVSTEIEQQLAALMHESAVAWNRGDLDGFLATYKDDAQTAFMAPQITYGLPDIKSRYARSYFKDGKPKARLSYDDLKYRRLGSDYVLMTGRWRLIDPAGKQQEGYYSLIWENTDTGWKIIHDHSS